MYKIFLSLICVFSTFSVASNNDVKLTPYLQNTDAVNVLVDPRLELLSVVQLLNDYFLISRYEQQYKQDAINYFKKHQHHEAVQYFDTLSKKGFRFSAPAESVLYLNQDFTVNDALTIPSHIMPNGVSKSELLKFYKLLREFAIDSDFSSFYLSKRNYYVALVANTAAMIQGVSDVKRLESFYGKSNASYNIVLVSLFHHGGFGPEVVTAQGNELFSLIGPSGSNENIAYFGDVERLAELINHEFSHSFIRQVFAANKLKINEFKALLEPIADDMKKQGYATWESSLNEHIVRAVTTYIAFQKDQQLGINNLNYQKSKKYIYLDYILAHFEKYQANRGKYATFDSYFPEILNGLHEI